MVGNQRLALQRSRDKFLFAGIAQRGRGKERKRKGENRHANLLTSQPAFSATSGGELDRNGRKISTTLAIKARHGNFLDIPEILACTSTDHIRRGTNRAFAATSRPYFFLSTSGAVRVSAIWSRYSEAPNMSYRHENWSPFGRLFGDRERHYHEYKHPTTAILMVVRSQQATPPGCQESHVPTASALPQCQENVFCFFVLLAPSVSLVLSASLSLYFPLSRSSCSLAFCSPSRSLSLGRRGSILTWTRACQ